jgi:hypothetical protein
MSFLTYPWKSLTVSFLQCLFIVGGTLQ